MDLLRSRFLSRPAPLPELVNALMMLRSQGDAVFDPWRKAMWSALPRAAMPLLELVFPEAGPEYLDSFEPSLAGGVDDVLTGPPEMVKASYPYISRPVTPWVKRLAEGEKEAQMILARALKAAHDTVFGRMWERVEASYQEDLAYRHPLLLGDGIGAALASVFPDAEWHGLTLEVPGRTEREVHLDGQGIVLAPSAFWTGRPLVSNALHGRPAFVVYAARIPLPLVDQMGDPDRALAPLIGRTRAAVLAAIVTNPATTTTALAQRLGISPGRASEHASVLREAGLISTHRHRNTVLHTPTRLGTQLQAS